jgi:excisionase family DNA binding protein
MNKDEAAAYLGISTRTLGRYVNKGALQVKYEGAKTRPIAVYEQEDLDALKAELETPLIKPKITANEIVPVNDNEQRSDMSLTVQHPLADFENPLDKLVSSLSVLSVANKLLLTLPEVQALTGLSRGILKEAIKAGELKAKIIGKSYRCKRQDVEAFINRLDI